MGHRPLIMLFVSITVLMHGALHGVFAQEAPPGSPERAVPQLRERLVQLHPSRPAEYLELGEEVLAEMPTPEGRHLARTLLVLAFELDPVSDGPSPIKTSACLALASIAFDDAERRWLELLASTRSAQPLTLAPGGSRQRAHAQGHSLAHDVAELIARLRAENAANQHAIASDAQAMAIIDSLSDAIGEDVALFDRLESRPVCPECGSRRTVRARSADDDTPFELCPTCAGNPGARLDAASFMRTLRVEAALIEADVRTWSGRLHLDSGAPMRETQGQSIASFFGIDPKKPFWSPAQEEPNRIGSWTKEPGRAEGPRREGAPLRVDA